MNAQVIGQVSQEEMNSNKVKTLSLEFMFIMAGIVSVVITYLLFKVTVPKNLIECGYAAIIFGLVFLAVGFMLCNKQKNLITSFSSSLIASGMFYVIVGWKKNNNIVAEHFVEQAMAINWLSLTVFLALISCLFKVVKFVVNKSGITPYGKVIDNKVIENIHAGTFFVFVSVYVMAFSTDFQEVMMKNFS